jgi:hypothetical protein
MQEISLVTFSGIFALRNGVSEEEFFAEIARLLSAFHRYGVATGYRVMRREALDGFGKRYRHSRIEVNSSIQTWSGSMPRTNTSNNMTSGYTPCM